MVEVPVGPVPEAAAAVRHSVHGRPLVALGGGRVIDSAKAIAAVDGLRCAAVPTTLSGAEMTRIHRLPAGAPPPPRGLVRPELVVADPGAMTSLDRQRLTASAMNALAHGVEALYGPRTNPAVQAAALRGAELVAVGLEAGATGGEALGVGALLCAWALDGAGLGVHHVVCQTVVRTAGTPHAETNAAVLPHVVRHIAAHAPSEIARLARALDPDARQPAPAADRIAALAAGASGLAALGVEPGAIDGIAEAARGRPELAMSPGRPGREEVVTVLARAL